LRNSLRKHLMIFNASIDGGPKRMIEMIERIIKKIIIITHKYVNFKIYKNGVTLYGIPKLIHRSKIIIKENVTINDNVFIHGAGGVVIGEKTIISYGVCIISTGLITDGWNNIVVERIHKNEKIEIGKNVWLCANTTILPGVTIKDNIIVAAGSIVTKNLLEDGWIYGGVPAKKIKKIKENN
jgi:acetyltransferase-like isoleucine patch superfamily enzyme